MEHLKECALFSVMYADDYDDRFQVADKWMDVPEKYLKNRDEFQDVDLDDPKAYGFAFRDEASSVKQDSFERPSSFILIFQSDINARSAHSGLGSMPFSGRKDGKNKVAFVDMHVRALKAQSEYGSLKPDWLTEDAKAGPRPHPAQKPKK